jgi:hypothetical protein
VLKKCEQTVVEAGCVEQGNRFCVVAQLQPCVDFQYLFEGADASGNATNASASFVHGCLAFMHCLDHDQLFFD